MNDLTQVPVSTVQMGKLPGTYFCVRCDCNRWFVDRGSCAQCGHREHETAAEGGLNPTREQLAAMRRREHEDPQVALHRKMERLASYGITW
jgi:hypothetical protein